MQERRRERKWERERGAGPGRERRKRVHRHAMGSVGLAFDERGGPDGTEHRRGEEKPRPTPREERGKKKEEEERRRTAPGKQQPRVPKTAEKRTL